MPFPMNPPQWVPSFESAVSVLPCRERVCLFGILAVCLVVLFVIGWAIRRMLTS